ncbi:DUF922 domain-containing protein [Saccharospirillum salsuginis]|uniref:DUF922 domain-containing protein n=1 Tax=Saccharospirillum salsuginis TaxID=418750 RepID=A0A918KET1_9GAMM|nr:DUF922 domain-containing protein [Saccharospirillum salsuginis]GGX58605.1 hypothetical protein GCM10007392_28150 [Saccharospirillum salsuginis]
MRRGWWVGVLAALALNAVADVQQSLDYRDYPVKPRSDESISDALYRASPILEAGRVFHGYTRWWVEWRFWWRETANRQCRIDRVSVEVQGEIQLPRLDGGTPSQRERFNRYREALHQHELVHYGFGLRAGREIENSLRNLPPEASCLELETRANETGYEILRDYRQLEDRYDRETEHGRTQGAWLED